MIPGQIRSLVIGVFSWNKAILVAESYDPGKQQHFYRPIGGGIHFGEYSQAALVREVREEFGAEIDHLRYLGTLENVFIYNDQPGHEIVQVYDAEFVERSLYERGTLVGLEDSGLTFKAFWKPLIELRHNSLPLYPTGLLELLQKHGLI
ncbi:MAG: NUDIX hydrolase [Anaerolineae bacterium]|nr:NUDIX hydrolase [Anaerolineales bacterium]MCQ3972779.1 DNA mismatch repair protein MutT [Anaerolineae bacterium]